MPSEYRQCMEKLEKRRKQRMNLMSSETRAREIRERKLLLRHLQVPAKACRAFRILHVLLLPSLGLRYSGAEPTVLV